MRRAMRGNGFAWLVGKRFLLSLKGQRFLGLLTLFGLFLVLSTVALTYLVSSVAEGFSADLERKLLHARPHIEVALSRDLPENFLAELERDPDVLSTTRAILFNALLKGGVNGEEGVTVWGLDRHSLRAKKAWHCDFLQHSESLPPMMLGTELFESLNPGAELVSTFSLLYPFGDVDPFGHALPSERTFSFQGTCESGIYPLDRKLAIIPPDEARRLLGDPELKWNRLFIDIQRPFEVAHFLEKWGERLAPFGTTSTWMDDNKTVLGALKLERKLFTAVVLLVFFLASLSLYGMLGLLVVEKLGDFAVLSVLGMRSQSIFGILCRMSGFLGLIGAGLGGLLGFAMVEWLSRYPLPLPEAYYVRELYVRQNFGALSLIVLLSATVQFSAALLPALWLRKRRAVEILRFIEGGIV